MLKGDEWISGPQGGDRWGGRHRRERDRALRRGRPSDAGRRPTGHGRGIFGPVLRAVIAAVVITGAGILTYSLTRTHAPATVKTAHYENPDAGYAFDYPANWKLTVNGTTTIVSHPSHQAIVSFGLGATGELRAASDVLVSEIKRNNRDVQLGAPQSQTVAGHPALAVNGIGANNSGQRIRFLAVTVAAANRNFSIVIFVAINADVTQVVGPAQSMLSSFLPPGG